MRTGRGVTHVIAGATMSIDGFVADKHGHTSRLYPDLAALHGGAYMKHMVDETGAVVMGRRTFEMAEDSDSYADHYEFQTPIFVVTHRVPETQPKENDHLHFTFVTDGLARAVKQAKKAAGKGKSVRVVGGMSVLRKLLVLGLVDELRVDVMPVLLGEGMRFLGTPGLADLRLEKAGVEQAGERTSLCFRVLR